MSIVVEHEKRRSEILERALKLFGEQGYEDVTFQKIADRCDITRTTLYIYFRNKREIFVFSIKQMVAKINDQIEKIVNDSSLNAIDALEHIMDYVLDESIKNINFFKMLLPYLMRIQRNYGDSEKRVNRRTIRIRHFLSTVIINGQKKGEIKKVSVKELNNLLYSFMEDSIFRLAFYGSIDVEEYRKYVALSIEQFRQK